MDEVDVLRSRVEQQAELIMLLKQRAEEHKEAAKAADRRTTDARAKLAETIVAKDKVQDELSRLQGLFKTLNENHEEIVKLKDQYKTDNATLRKAHGRFDAVVEERDDALKQLQEMTAKLGTQTTLLLTATTDKDALSQRLGQCESERATLESRVATLEDELSSTVDRVARSLAEAQAAEQSREGAHNDAKALNSKFEDTKTKLKATEVQLAEVQASNERLAATTTAAEQALQEARLQLELLQQRLDAATDTDSLQHQLASLNQEYKAYKRHASTLLTKEREMNARLRHLADPD
eukprot:m.43821 g.43821  ORF g.43821 m.43821 type:complete len:294 (-) comp11662_c0_seq1:182-1063(-)